MIITLRFNFLHDDFLAFYWVSSFEIMYFVTFRKSMITCISDKRRVKKLKNYCFTFSMVLLFEAL